MRTAHEQNFTSADGATIGYETVGEGPSVIVIPGVLSVASDFREFANALAKSFTVHTIERRGRGRSSPQDSNYSIETDRNDVHALQEVTGARYLFGHSYGGFIALEAAWNNPLLEKLAVYEPGISVDGSLSIGWQAEYEQLLAQDKRLDAFVAFSRAAGPKRAQQTPRWLMKLLLPRVMKRDALRQKLELLETNLREHEQIARLDNSYDCYAQVSASTLLLSGGKSDLAWIEPAITKLSTTLPRSERIKFPQLNHFGPDQSGPVEVAEAVARFFLR